MQELAHLVGVAGENHDQVFAHVLHHLQHRVDRLLPECVVLGVLQAVCFVDKEHAALGALHDFSGLDRGLAGVFGDEFLPRYLHQVTFAEDAELADFLCVIARKGGLARAGASGKYRVERHLVRGQAARAALRVDPGERDHLRDPRLCGLLADQRIEIDFLDWSPWRGRRLRGLRFVLLLRRTDGRGARHWCLRTGVVAKMPCHLLRDLGAPDAAQEANVGLGHLG